MSTPRDAATDDATVSKFVVAAQLREVGSLLSHRKGASFHARAYRKAADALEALSEAAFGTLLRESRLSEVSGIGDSIARHIGDLATRGRSPMLDALRAELPASIVELAGLPSMSLTRARALGEALGIKTIDDLERACAEERVRTVRGFGPKTEQSILRGIGDYKRRANRILLVEARPIADQLKSHVALSGVASQVVVAGDVRRWVETTHEVSVVAETEFPTRAVDCFVSFPLLARIEERTERSAVGRLSNGARVRIEAATPRHFAWTLLRTSGAEPHLAALDARAKARGIPIAERAFSSEDEIYRSLDLVFVPPELREGNDEIAEASMRTSPFALVEESDLRGMVHCHTTHSDGKDSILAMAERADALGLSYLTITDHSPAAHYAGGVSVDRLKAQWDEIARVQEDVRVKLLRGTESDILADGSLDYPDAILEQLDVIIASVHGRMKMDGAAMTSRLTRLMELPMFKIWGHPLGRLLQRREPFDCDMEHILDVIARSRVAIEINGDPYRLDLEPRWIRAARRRGISFVVSTDAHSTRGMNSVAYGIAMARRGGLTRTEVLNTLDAAAFAAAVKPIGASALKPIEDTRLE